MDRVGVALSVGGGEAYVAHTADAAFSPYGQVQGILVFRQLREWLQWDAAALDLELHAGALLSVQPYCINFIPDGRGCDWRRLLGWRFPFTAELNLLLDEPFRMSVGVGAGAAWSIYQWAHDANKSGHRWLGTARAHFGFRVARSITLELESRFFWNEDPRERRVDQSGVVSYAPARDTGLSVMLGGVFRTDNLF
jgi:hypothetical protein